MKSICKKIQYCQHVKRTKTKAKIKKQQHEMSNENWSRNLQRAIESSNGHPFSL